MVQPFLPQLPVDGTECRHQRCSTPAYKTPTSGKLRINRVKQSPQMSTARLFAARGPLGLLNRANSARIASLPRPNFQGTRALASEANDEFTTIATLRMDPERPYTTSIMSRGKHGLVADEPAELGGTDLCVSLRDRPMGGIG